MSNFKPNTGAKTAFNETIAESNKSYIEGSAIYGLIPANFRQFTATGGSTGAENRLFKVSTGTSVGGYGAIQSFRALPHRVGKSVSCRLSGYFEDNVANSWQGIGMIAVGEELSFGYNGTSFGVWHRYGGLSEVRTITVTTGAGGAETLTLTLNSVPYSIPITSGTASHNAYEIAAWLNANQSVWGADNIDDTVIINALSDGAKSGTYTYSASGTGAGSIAQNTAGVTKTSTHIPQADWNGEQLDFTLDPSKGNLYQIQYQNMGYGNVIFSIMSPNSNKYIRVHTIKWTNSSTILGIPNPSMRVGLYAASTGSTTNLNVYASGMEASVGGSGNKTRNPRGFVVSQNVTTTNETVVLALRNRRTYNGYNNQVEIEPLVCTIANDTNRTVRVRVRTALATGLEQIFTTSGTNLVSDVSTTQIVYSSGNIVAAGSIAAGGEKDIDLEKLQISLPPSLMLLVTVVRTSTAGTNSNIDTTLDWYEDL